MHTVTSHICKPFAVCSRQWLHTDGSPLAELALPSSPTVKKLLYISACNNERWFSLSLKMCASSKPCCSSKASCLLTLFYFHCSLQVQALKNLQPWEQQTQIQTWHLCTIECSIASLIIYTRQFRISRAISCVDLTANVTTFLPTGNIVCTNLQTSNIDPMVMKWTNDKSDRKLFIKPEKELINPDRWLLSSNPSALSSSASAYYYKPYQRPY